MTSWVVDLVGLDLCWVMRFRFTEEDIVSMYGVPENRSMVIEEVLRCKFWLKMLDPSFDADCVPFVYVTVSLSHGPLN